MKLWRFAVLPMAMFASQALAHIGVKIGTDDNDISTYVDKDSIQRGTDSLIYFTDFDDSGDDHDAAVAANCQTRVLYLLKYAGEDYPDWRNHGKAVTAGSVEESELKYVCANAG